MHRNHPRPDRSNAHILQISSAHKVLVSYRQIRQDNRQIQSHFIGRRYSWTGILGRIGWTTGPKYSKTLPVNSKYLRPLRSSFTFGTCSRLTLVEETNIVLFNTFFSISPGLCSFLGLSFESLNSGNSFACVYDQHRKCILAITEKPSRSSVFINWHTYLRCKSYLGVELVSRGRNERRPPSMPKWSVASTWTCQIQRSTQNSIFYVSELYRL